MLAKDKVKSRIDSGITYAEFSYMILQALDFLYLYENRGVTLQVAGSDQWGNITSGIELIRKKLDKEAYGMVMPLVTDSTGKKFGKTEGNALWLNKNKTSSYEMYQYLINLEDSMIIDYLKKLTFLTKEKIEDNERKHKECPEKRIAHQALAKEIITDLHGEEEYKKAVKMSEALFSGNVKDLSAKDIDVLFKDAEKKVFEKDTNIVDLLVEQNVCSSKREAREFVSGGSISINGDKITDLEKVLSKEDSIEGKYIILRRGKKKYFLIECK